MKKVLVLIYESFAEFEITVATAMVRNSFKVETVAATKDVVVSESGLQYLPHKTFEEINPDEYEALIVPGGDLFYVKDCEALFELTSSFHGKNKLVAAICSGTYVLARAGVLEGKPYTVTLNQEQRSFLGCFDETSYRYEPVVKSGSIISAQGHAYVEFGLAIGQYLGVVKDQDYVESFYKGRGNKLMEE